MEDLSTFLELPLDRDLYQPKSKLKKKKPPLNVLITEAHSKIAHHLMYKICSGEVFGPNQEVILHLIFSKDKKDPKLIITELYSCAFPVFVDVVLTSDPQKVYKNVDLVVMITPFEELSGHTDCSAFLHQVLVTLQAAKNMVKYAKKDSKLIISGPSTKGSIALLNILRQLNSKLRYENVSGVTILDETITKGLIAAKLKTTTTHIKNVVIWGSTHADIRNGTVFMYPPEDRGQYKKVHIPLTEALQDDNWVQSDLLKSIRRRIIAPHLLSHGTAVASATAKHLKLLFQGSEDEISSMGVIVPLGHPYGLTENLGFSLPVTTQNGRIIVNENVSLEVYTYLVNLNEQFNLVHGDVRTTIRTIKSFPWDMMNHKRDWIEDVANDLKPTNTKLKYILCRLPRFEVAQIPQPNRQSVAWNTAQSLINIESTDYKRNTILRFTDL